MPDSVVGMFWNCNEADILEETLSEAIKHVDSLFIADDNSKDKSWEIIKSFAKNHSDKVEHIQNKRKDPRDQGQRQEMLEEIKKRYKPENTLVQIVESDIMILDTNIREAWADWARDDIAMTWQLLNAVRDSWIEADTYPNWKYSIKKIMPLAHWMETMLYTFRPLPKLNYNLDTWRPWPQGWSYYSNKDIWQRRRSLVAPLLAHYGYRGPTHFYQKYKGKNIQRKHPTWDNSSIDKVRESVYYFNGEWNRNVNTFQMSRGGWKSWRKS